MHKKIHLISYLIGLIWFVIGFEFLIVNKLHYFYITSAERIYAWHGYSFPHLANLIPVFFLLRRVLVWLKTKRIYAPKTYTGWRYAIMMFLLVITFLACIATFSTGIFVVIYCSFIALPIMLMTEILDMRTHEYSKP